jgi:peroxiredoxin Q/BCP
MAAKKSGKKKIVRSKVVAAASSARARSSNDKTPRTKKATAARRPKVAAAATKLAAAPAKVADVATRKSIPRKPVAARSAPAASKQRGGALEAKGRAATARSVEAPIAEGDLAPPFELADHSGTTIKSAELAGKAYVLYFYPKDDTPGCTVEACGFRDAAREFDKVGVRVIGVSPDNGPSHQKFRAKHELPFTLLSDTDKALASAYGAWAKKKNYGREYMGVVRSTFLVGADGVVRRAWRAVRVNGHVAQVQTAAESL